MQTHREIQRCLPAELDDHAGWLLDIDDVHHVFEGQRFKVKSIRSVIVSRDSFRITVNHDGFIARLMQRERRMATAIVEFNSLTDAIRAGTENHDLPAIRRL